MPTPEQPPHAPRLHVRELVGRLSEPEHLELVNAVGSGLHDARLAAQCLTDPAPQAEDVVQLLAYLSRSIRRLESARSLLQRVLEDVR
jgi:hypothetical protein